MVHFCECSTVATNYNTETQIEMRDRTVEHFPVGEEGEGPEAARHVSHHEGQERHRGRHGLPGNGQRVRLVGFLSLVQRCEKLFLHV